MKILKPNKDISPDKIVFIKNEIKIRIEIVIFSEILYSPNISMNSNQIF